MESQQVARLAALAAEEKKGHEVIILDISGISLIADYFVIVGAGNRVQLAAIADRVEEVLAEHGVPVLHREGHANAAWVLLDYGGVVVHVMLDEAREFYALERLWGDAPVFRPDALTT
ncbi:MAG TPA: ribosome silencing factor, partial [Firmicutes bacterium]|nr:ribosome silencing factor [Bacillota bacterium]